MTCAMLCPQFSNRASMIGKPERTPHSIGSVSEQLRQFGQGIYLSLVLNFFLADHDALNLRIRLILQHRSRHNAHPCQIHRRQTITVVRKRG